MSFVHPLALLGLPIFLGLTLLLRNSARLQSGLPGNWHRVVEPALRPTVAALTGSATLARRSPLMAIAVLLCIAIARPMIDRGGTADFTNLAGRVLILDLSGTADVAAQRIAAQRLIELAPDLPTAIVAVTGRAYNIVPPTTDAAFAARYLAVLTPDIVPATGRALFRGIIEADRVLARAGIAVGQTILISTGAPPAEAMSSTPNGPERLVMVLAPVADWSRFAAAHGATLLSPDALPESVEALRARVRALRRTEMPGAALDLAPFLVAAAAVLWLGLFRRGSET